MAVGVLGLGVGKTMLEAIWAARSGGKTAMEFGVCAPGCHSLVSRISRKSSLMLPSNTDSVECTLEHLLKVFVWSTGKSVEESRLSILVAVARKWLMVLMVP